MKRFWEWAKSAWLDFFEGPLCEKHPGHRQYEVDAESDLGMMFCSECWAEFQEKYGI